MNLILNRDFTMLVDGWHHISPFGEFPFVGAYRGKCYTH